MISKNDLILILTEISDKNNIDTTQMVTKVLTSKNIPFDVLKYVNEQRELEVSKFYSYIRKSYNNKKSKLYINIVKEIDDVNDVLTTLASLNLQLLLYSKQVEDKQLFFRQSRAEEITKVLNLYYQNYDLTNCLRLLHLIKADIIAFEVLAGKRQLQ